MLVVADFPGVELDQLARVVELQAQRPAARVIGAGIEQVGLADLAPQPDLGLAAALEQGAQAIDQQAVGGEKIVEAELAIGRQRQRYLLNFRPRDRRNCS